MLKTILMIASLSQENVETTEYFCSEVFDEYSIGKVIDKPEISITHYKTLSSELHFNAADILFCINFERELKAAN